MIFVPRVNKRLPVCGIKFSKVGKTHAHAQSSFPYQCRLQFTKHLFLSIENEMFFHVIFHDYLEYERLKCTKTRKSITFNLI